MGPGIGVGRMGPRLWDLSAVIGAKVSPGSGRRGSGIA